MLKRWGKFLADWRDEHGTRKRKAFTTKKGATKWQQRMQHEATLKKAHASGPSANSAARGPRRTPAAARTAPQPSSSKPSRARSAHTS